MRIHTSGSDNVGRAHRHGLLLVLCPWVSGAAQELERRVSFGFFSPYLEGDILGLAARNGRCRHSGDLCLSLGGCKANLRKATFTASFVEKQVRGFLEPG